MDRGPERPGARAAEERSVPCCREAIVIRVTACGSETRETREQTQNHDRDIGERDMLEHMRPRRAVEPRARRRGLPPIGIPICAMSNVGPPA